MELQWAAQRSSLQVYPAEAAPHRTLVGPLPHQTSDFDTYGPAIEYDSHLGWLIHIASEWRGGSASQVAGFLSQAVTGSFSQASVGKARC